MAQPEEEHPADAPTDEVKPYQLHVSSKYLELTQQKLELTRLPHEISSPKSTDWWEPKPQAEPLIDFWLEQYSWRDQEAKFNASVPQFRVNITIPGSEASLRIHFIHVRSPQANAVPLLLIPPFPFTNLALSHLINAFTDPDDAAVEQPFHLVIPSLPGLGFSDALPNNTPVIPATAEMLDVMMKRMDYEQYIATNAGPSANSPSEIDWKLAYYLSVHYQESCLGLHFISPPLSSPSLQETPLAWAKWKLASVLRQPILGYSKDDFQALQRLDEPLPSKRKPFTPWQFGFKSDGASEPNTLAYALCDSPTGLLLFVMMLVRILGPKKKFSPSDIITLTELIWLPGPEATLRFWAHCASHSEEMENRKLSKPRATVTVFLGDEETEQNGQGEDAELAVLPRPIPDTYSCPTWAATKFNVLSSSRITGKPGLLAWERPEVIVQGCRALAKEILATDKRMQVSELPGGALLEQVVVDNTNIQAPAEISGTTVQAGGSSSEFPVDVQPKKSGEFLEPPTPMYGEQGSLQPITPPKRASREVTPEEPRQTEREGEAEGEEEEEGEGEEEELFDSSGGSPDTVVAVGNKDPLPTT